MTLLVRSRSLFDPVSLKQDVLANCDLERDEKNEREETPHTTLIAGREHDRGQDHETVGVDGEATEEERERRLREEASKVFQKPVSLHFTLEK